MKKIFVIMAIALVISQIIVYVNKCEREAQQPQFVEVNIYVDSLTYVIGDTIHVDGTDVPRYGSYCELIPNRWEWIDLKPGNNRFKFEKGKDFIVRNLYFETVNSRGGYEELYESYDTIRTDKNINITIYSCEGMVMFD